MRSIKKAVTGILALTFAMAPMASLNAKALILPEEILGTRYEEPAQLLAALKIMVGDDDGAFRLDDNIKRSEVAKMAVHALGLEDLADSAKGESKFPDVSVNHWANGYINIATSQGLIEGDDNGNFRPNDSITYAEAMAIFVRALGYEVMAEDKGGFPNGYIVVAGNNGMTKNVQGSSNVAITRGNVAYLTSNSLDVKLMERVGYGENASYEVTDKTLLKDKLKVTRLEGQVTAIPTTSLEGESNLDKGEIKIGDTIYETAYNMNNLFGHNVEYYVRENKAGEDEVILAIAKKEKNASVKIQADLFEQITTKNDKKAIEYYEKEDATKSTISAIEDNAKLIYNGKAATLNDENLNMKGKSGNITMLDTDRNGIYDVIFVTDLFNIVVDEVTSSGKIIDKYGAPTIKLDEDENISYRILRGLQEIKVSELKEFDVLSVAKSKDGELFDIVVSNEKVSGKITGTDEDGVYIAGKHYKVAKNHEEVLKIGTEGTFYLDIEGKIAAVDNSVTASDNYGYLIRAYASEETETATFRIFTKEGKDQTFKSNEKIRFNNLTKQNAADVVKELVKDGATQKQLITYTTNSEGKITAIYTSKDNTANGGYDKNFTLDYKLDQAEFNAKLNKLGSIRLTEETFIFDIQNDVDDYSIATLDMFEDKQKYNVMVFDTTEEYTAKAVVVTNAEFNTNAEASIAVVQKVSATINEDDEETEKLYALNDGKEVEIIAESTGILVKGENKALQNGDIIQYKTNDKGEIVKIRVLFDIETKGTEATQNPVEDLETVYGKVTKKFTNSINVTVNDQNVRNFQIPEDAKIYSVDTTKAKNNVTVATSGDIQAYDADEGNRVFIRLYDEVVKEIVIIK